jgi:hypothetical protein
VKGTPTSEVKALTEAHERAIGKIVIAWNEYQTQLGDVFGKLFGQKQWSLALAAWHVLENERAQRAMLAAVARAKLKATDPLRGELLWLLASTDGMISEQRNTGVHMPLMRYWDENGNFHILPLTTHDNKRAAKMTGRNLLTEFGHYERQIREMRGYAMAISFALTPKGRRRGSAKMPNRPQLHLRAPGA